MHWIEHDLHKTPVADDEALAALSVPPVQSALVEHLARQSLSVSVSVFIVERNASNGTWVQKAGLLGKPLVTAQEICWMYNKTGRIITFFAPVHIIFLLCFCFFFF
jgi:hypothetical protein